MIMSNLAEPSDDETNEANEQSASLLRRLGFKTSLVLPLLFIGGLAAIALIYLLGMQSIGWSESKKSGLTLGISAFQSHDNQIYLYASPQTTQYLHSVGGNYDVLLTPWRKFFAAESLKYTEISSIDALPANTKGLLILPSALALNDSEREKISAFRDQGGNLLLSWATGSRDAEGAWRGYDFLSRLTGIVVEGEIPAGSEERNLNINANTPLTYGLPAGQRIWLGNATEPPLRLRGGKSAGLYSNWQRTLAGSTVAGAVQYDEFGPDKGNARWLMLGFSENSWEIQHNQIYPLIEGAIQWLQHQPMMYKADWPAPYQASQFIAMDTEDGFTNAPDFAQVMEQAQFPTTFFCLTSVATQYPDIVKKLAQTHEIGYHADVHTSFKDQPESLQSARIQKMQSDMQNILGDNKNVTGFRAPTEGYDGTTEKLLHQHGILYHAADPQRSSARLPLFSNVTPSYDATALIVLPRTQRDDLNLIHDGASASTSNLENALINDFNSNVAMGGMGFFSIHSQNFAPGSPFTTVLPNYLAEISKQSKTVWFATAGQLSQWWRERERLTYSVTGSTIRAELNVTISGDNNLGNVVLILTTPYANALAKIQALKTNSTMPDIKLIDAQRYSLNFGNLPPGNYSYSITFADS
jgi:peptidoglycan/xylan/chitin deacetylase (PgdA/CDA1 family)